MNLNQKIKIFVDAHIFDNAFQGTATYIHGLYSALVQKSEFEITLCAQNIEQLKSIFKDSRFKFVQLKSKSGWRRLLFELPFIIKEGKYDYAHFQYITPFLKSCKHINTIHDILFLTYKDYFPWSYRFIKGNLFRLSAKKSDIVLTVSDFSKKDINQKFKIPSDKIFVTPNAAPTRTEAGKLNIKDQYGIGDYILFVSRFEPRKNHLGLLKAYLEQKLYEKEYSLVFIGSKNEAIEAQAYNVVKDAIPEAYSEYIHFFEGLSFEELNAFYSQASCFVYPSFAEGFGIPPLEAAINNCKVLCSNQTAMKEFDFFKYTFDPNNESMFGNKLNTILEDANYPYQAIRQSVLSKYNWESIAEDYENLIKNNFLK